MQALAKFLPDSSVTEVLLENCGITSAGCDALADLLIHCKRLKCLDISTNILLDAGILKLAKALERTSSLQVEFTAQTLVINFVVLQLSWHSRRMYVLLSFAMLVEVGASLLLWVSLSYLVWNLSLVVVIVDCRVDRHLKWLVR